MSFKILIGVGLLLIHSLTVRSQEALAPLDYNPLLKNRQETMPVFKTTALSLPFFEDFTGDGIFPDPAKWLDRSVYINNSMPFKPVSRGVATFDALNERGGPYDSFVNTSLRFADSLTSQFFDLSTHGPADSIYLSFFYQPQGNGFAPEVQDSLFLYFRRSNNSWARVWFKEGTALHEFRQVMIPVTNQQFFHNEFQFRFVNKASMNINDDVWNIDYIRMAANRSRNDTAVPDVATATDPSFLLNDYASMPYRQFAANMNAELAPQHYFYVKNNYNTSRSVVYGYTATETTTNTPLFTSGTNTDAIPPNDERQFQFPVYNINFSAPNLYSRVVFEQKYYAPPQGGADPSVNDTITRKQVFDNYLAYDDGTAEKSYFLNQFATLPAKTAIEFHLNQTDTIRGVAIYFGRQVPLATNKFFSVGVYDDIAVNGGTEQLIYQQDLLFPSYVDTINHFWVYRFDSPVQMNAGTFYMGTIQPAASGSDSLYFGLDVNRIGGNHLYFDVNGFWEPSIISGAVMIRPIIGQPVFGTHIASLTPPEHEWSIAPNPVSNDFSVRTDNFKGSSFRYYLLDMQGRVLRQGEGTPGVSIDLSGYAPGIYFLKVLAEGLVSKPKKIIKL